VTFVDNTHRTRRASVLNIKRLAALAAHNLLMLQKRHLRFQLGNTRLQCVGAVSFDSDALFDMLQSTNQTTFAFHVLISSRK
jgi:hypothetical protein